MSNKVLYFGFASLCLAYLLWRGGAPERWSGLIAMAGSIATPLAASGHLYHGWEEDIWLLDTMIFLAMLHVASIANRYWPIWIAAIQLCGVMTHFAAALDSKVLPSAYYLMTAYGAYIIWALMLAGAVRHRERLRKYGSDAPWRVARTD